MSEAGNVGLTEASVGWVNGEPAMMRHGSRRLISVSTFVVRDGRIHAILTVLNPDKLHRVAAEGPAPRQGSPTSNEPLRIQGEEHGNES